jgi:hypothetical protein
MPFFVFHLFFPLKSMRKVNNVTRVTGASYWKTNGKFCIRKSGENAADRTDDVRREHGRSRLLCTNTNQSIYS